MYKLKEELTSEDLETIKHHISAGYGTREKILTSKIEEIKPEDSRKKKDIYNFIKSHTEDAIIEFVIYENLDKELSKKITNALLDILDDAFNKKL